MDMNGKPSWRSGADAGRSGRGSVSALTYALLAVAIALTVAALVARAAPAAAQEVAISFSGSSYTPPTACALYGASDYTNNWIGINFLVIAIGLLITSMVLVFARLLPRSVSSRVTEMSKTEITQLMLGAVIVIVLLSFTTFACSTVGNLSSKLTGQTMDPFTYADYYIGNLTFNTGLSLLSEVYSDSISLSVASRIIPVLTSTAGSNGYISGSRVVQVLQGLKFTTASGRPFVAIGPNFDPSVPLALLADEYLVIFSTVIVTSIGTLMLQYILIPFIRYTAFAVLLPVALILRSIAYSGYGGNGLRSAANVFIAVAIAAYLVYPLAVAFDSYMIHWIFTSCSATITSGCNPNFSYLNTAYTVRSIQPNSYFSGISGYASNSVGAGVSIPSSLSSPLSPLYLYTQLAGFNTIEMIFTAPYITIDLVRTMSQYVFTAVILFALNFAVTIGFAMSLTKALNNGFVGASNFWGSI